jgi:hypothetical protein
MVFFTYKNILTTQTGLIMINLKRCRCVLTILILLLPVITFSKEESIETSYKHDPEKKAAISIHSRIIEATMFLNIDFNLMKKKGILNIVNDKKFSFFTNSFGTIPTIPDEYSSLYYYGSGKKYDINIVINGDFTNMSILKHVTHILENNNIISEILNVKSGKYKNGVIHTFKVKINEQNNKSIVEKIFVSEVNNSKFIISFSLYDAKEWMAKPINKYFKPILEKDKIFQFIFKVKKTIKNMDKTNNVDNYIFQSIVLKELEILHLTVSEKDKKLYIGALLTTIDEDTAKKVSQIINGLLAINQLSINENKIKEILINNSVNKQINNYIQIGSYIPLKELTSIKSQ